MKRNNQVDVQPLTFIILLVFLFNSCSSGDEPPEPVPVPVTVGITSFIGEAASFVAEEKGFFRNKGLDVTLRVNNAGSESVRQLLAGQVDIAHIAETPILYSILDSTYFTGEKRGKLQIVANMILTNTIQKVVARRDSGIETPRDVVGKRVALAGGTQSEYHLDSFLLEYQIDIEEIDTLHMSVQSQVQAIKNGDIDVAVTWEPQATQIEYILENNSVLLPTRLTYSTLWLTAVLDHFARENPEIIVAYLESLFEAQNYIRENPDWSLNLLSERTSVPYEVVYEAVFQIDYELNLSERMLNLLKEQKRWMVDTGVADQTDVNIIEMIDFRFMEEVYPEGITLIR